MKTVFQMLTVVALVGAAIPAFAEKASNTMMENMTPETMFCEQFDALDETGKSSLALMVKSSLADDATVQAMPDADLTNEVMKRCSGHPGSTVLDAFKM